MDLLHILASPVAVFLFASLLVVLAVGTAVWWGRVCAGLIAPLRAARAIVEGTPDPLSFGTDFPTINEQVAQTLSGLGAIGRKNGPRGAAQPGVPHAGRAAAGEFLQRA